MLALNQGALDAVGPLDRDRLAWIVDLAVRAVVVEDHTIAGFAITIAPGTAYDSVNYRWFGERLDDFIYLDRIAIAHSHRRQGLGTLVYDDVEQKAAPRGQMALEVYADPPNDASLAFHANRGYTEVGRLTQGNGKTSAMLVKPLC